MLPSLNARVYRAPADRVRGRHVRPPPRLGVPADHHADARVSALGVPSAAR